MPKIDREHERRRLTPRQLQILTFIRDSKHRNGYSPTMQEIADELGVSKVTVFEHVGALVKKGLLRRLPHKARSLELTEHVEFPDRLPTQFPMAGRIAAGRPIEAVENVETLDLEEIFQCRNETFVLQVTGDSMVEDGIRDGDFVVVEQREAVRNGETVVALVAGEEATLKRFYREGARVRLQPANETFEPIVVPAKDVEVQGVVMGVVRRL